MGWIYYLTHFTNGRRKYYEQNSELFIEGINTSVQDFQRLIEKIIECCEDNN